MSVSWNKDMRRQLNCYFRSSSFGGKNIFKQMFLRKHTNKSDLWKELLESNFIHSPHFYWWGNRGLSVKLAPRPVFLLPCRHLGCRASFVELIGNASPHMFLFNLRNIYSTNSVPQFCPFQFSSESKEMQTLYCWHSRMETKGYLVAWNYDNVVEVTTKGNP